MSGDRDAAPPDIAAELADAVGLVAGHPVYTEIDAGVNGNDLPMTVITANRVSQAGVLYRALFHCSVVAVTYAETVRAARSAHLIVASAIRNTVAHNEWLYSRVLCESEPAVVPGTGAAWPSCISTYSMYVRKENNGLRR